MAPIAGDSGMNFHRNKSMLLEITAQDSCLRGVYVLKTKIRMSTLIRFSWITLEYGFKINQSKVPLKVM